MMSTITQTAPKSQSWVFSRIRLLLCCLVVIAPLSGCQQKDNPGEWGSERVSEYISKTLELSGVELNATADGFEGSETREDGEVVKFTVIQSPTESELSYDAAGGRGLDQEGNIASNSPA